MVNSCVMKLLLLHKKRYSPKNHVGDVFISLTIATKSQGLETGFEHNEKQLSVNGNVMQTK